ncbi:MAG: histidinol dehydrogenase [Bryobacteraceae bacterium]
MIRIIKSEDSGALLRRRAARMEAAEAAVRPILEDVRRRGDKALLEYARKFDGFTQRAVRVSEEDLAAARRRLSPEFRRAVRTAAANIRDFARRQMPRAWMRQSGGVRVGQVVRPLGTVAAYVPAGRYPLPSTILMTAVPAQVAGVANICVASPKPVDQVWGTAAMLGLTRAFEMGGAQAIAAFAYGTRTVPKADRIVGPGNIYVAAAKKLLAGEVGIDFVAGPTEILIIAAGDGNPRYLAADLLAQAEHDVDASALLLTTSRRLAEAVAKEVERQLATLPTAAVAAQSIARNSAIVLVRSLEEAVEISNRFAPEHLSIPDARLLAGIEHAGSVFVGPFSPEAAGDYASGPNHVLPTGGAARIRGGLAVTDFVKVISVQQLSAAGLARLAPSIVTLARAEGLEAHARSVEVRTRAR